MSTQLRTSRAPLNALLQVADLPSEFAGFIKYEFDKHLYYYGAHFSSGYDRGVAGRDLAQYQTELLAFYWKHQPYIDKGLAAGKVGPQGVPCIFSNAYFGWEAPLAALGVRLLPPPWVSAEPGNELSIALFNQCRAVQELLRSRFAIFYHQPFYAVLRSLAANLEKFFAQHSARGLLVPYTNPFFEGISTAIFRRLGRPTFLCIHGLPARLDGWRVGEHPVDYLVVWGEAMKRRIVEGGRAPEAVLVSGHPDHSGRARPPISTKLDRVLVLGYSPMGAPALDAPYYHDRSLGLDYLWRVQSSLKRVGVTRARIRPHPSESVAWYRDYLDAGFYEVDESRTCAEALKQATLVIGPVSTVLIDAAVVGVNYVTFIPELPHYNPLGEKAFAPDLPFDGTDPRFPVARSEEALVDLLKKRAVIDASALPDYLSTAFHPEVIVEALKLQVEMPVRPVAQPVASVPPPAAQAKAVPAPLHIPEVTEEPAKPFELQILQTVRPFTMTPPEVTLNAMRAVAIAEERGIEGAIVECGVWRGGVSMAMMHQLKKCGGKRDVFLYDTFDGMSEPTEEDLSPTGEAASKLLAEHKKDEANHYWAFAPIDRVRRNIESVGYPMKRIRMVQGKVEETIPGVIPERIAVLRLDTDWYESTRHELEHLYSRLVPGGIMILDDYGFWQGARKAVDEFFETLTEKPVLHVVHDNLQSCVRWCVKP